MVRSMSVCRWGAVILAAILLFSCSSGYVPVSSSVPATTAGPASTASGEPPTTAVHVDDSPSGWVHTEPGAAIYISFAPDSTGKLTGNLSIVSTAASGTSVESGAYPLTGTLSGSSVALTFNETTWTGTVNRNTLVLNVPQRNGTIAQGHWARGSVDTYNAAVADLQKSAQTQSAISAVAAQDAATASSLRASADQETARVAAVYSAAASDIGSLSDVVGQIRTELAAVDQSVAAVATAAADPALTGTCEYGAASFALSGVQFALSGVVFAISSVDNVASQIPDTVKDLQGRLADLATSSQTPDQMEIIGTGNNAIQAAHAALTAANEGDTKSKAAAEAIYAKVQASEIAHCPGDAPGTPPGD